MHFSYLIKIDGLFMTDWSKSLKIAVMYHFPLKSLLFQLNIRTFGTDSKLL